MRIPKLWLLCVSLVGISHSNASQWPASLTTEPGDQWSLDGQVFQSFDGYPAVENTGLYTLLILKESGELMTQTVTLEAAQTASPEQTIRVDAEGPEIEVKWHRVSQEGDQVVIGPNSSLSYHIEGGQLTQIKVDDVARTPTQQRIDFDQPAAHVSLVAEDEFGNPSQWQQTLAADFTAPDINWSLQPPAIEHDGQWLSGGQSIAKLTTDDNLTTVQWTLNDQPVTLPQDGQLTVNHSDVIGVQDTLGNRSQQTLSWQVDNTPPELMVTVDGDTTAADGVVQLSTNQIMKLHTIDQGMGVKNQTYLGKRKQWKPLPKSFKFLNKGRYKIKISSVDHAGNELEQTLSIKVKRSRQ